jgi:group I intron endonuclease
MDNKYFYVYIIVNNINGKKYIGKRICKCKIEEDNYMGSGLALKRAKDKYGIDNFTKIILKVCKTEKEASEIEKQLILLTNATKSEDYYNIAEGGNGGNTRAGYSDKEMDEYKKKQGEWERTNECKNKISQALAGRKLSQETRDKMSKMAKNRTSALNSMSKQSVIVFDGETIIKPSKREIVEYMKDKYGIKGVDAWFRAEIPNKVKHKVAFCGYVNSEEYKQFLLTNK